MTIIKAERLMRRYGEGELEFVALKHLDLEIQAGEFVAIIGPSGAGKSTLLYQLSLLDEPTSGRIWISGRDVSDLGQDERTALRLRELGYVFQDYALLPELTSIENVALPLLMQGHPHSDAMRSAERALARIGLSDKKHNLPSQLSGGQQQRVSIARAVAHDPRIVFADEPTANLDSANGRLAMDALGELHAAGQTIVMVTHEEEYAKRAERIVEMKDGLVVSDRKR